MNSYLVSCKVKHKDADYCVSWTDTKNIILGSDANSAFTAFEEKQHSEGYLIMIEDIKLIEQGIKK